MAKKLNDAVDEKSTVTLKNNDDLIASIDKNIRKQFKNLDDNAIGYMSDDSDSITEVTGWVSTGSSLVDLRISNRPYGGIPVGRITEIIGLEGSGKSLLAGHILASTQKMGGLGVLLDSEFAISEEFLKAIGVDMSGPNKILAVRVEKAETAFGIMENIINSVRASDKKRLVTIVLDSIAGLSTEAEMEADFTKDGYMTQKAIILSKAFRKITNLIGKEHIAVVCTNQLRTKMNAGPFSNPYDTSGGMSTKYHTSVRLQVTAATSLKKKNEYGEEEVVGKELIVKVVKNRVGPPLRSAKVNVYFDSGIDDYASWLKVLTTYKIISQGGAYYTYNDNKFMAKDFPKMLRDDVVLKEELYQKICDKLIMKYRVNGETIDEDVISDSTDVEFD